MRLLCGAMQGALPPSGEWPAVVEVASRGWVAPALYLALSGNNQLSQVPDAEREYLAFLHDRNVARNLRLRAQLLESLRALNGRSIRPVLLKGAIHLFTASEQRIGARMISDLDIALEPSEVRQARAALSDIGYRDTVRKNDMARTEDAGTIELHSSPSGRSSAYLGGDLRMDSSLCETEGAAAWVPSRTSRALHLIVHDQIKEGDYWRLRIDLRHLFDLVELATAADPVDWQRLRTMLRDRRGRRALEFQATALNELFGARVPAELITRRARRRLLAALAAADRSGVGLMLKWAGDLRWALHRLTSGYVWRGPRDFLRRARTALAGPPKGSRL